MFAMLAATVTFSWCAEKNGVRTIRIGHNQSINHPTNIVLTAFANYIKENLCNKYKVEVFPSELLGSQAEMVQLTSRSNRFCHCKQLHFGNFQPILS